MTAIREPQFVVDAQGNPVAAVVDIQQYEALTEMGEALQSTYKALFDALDVVSKAHDARGAISAGGGLSIEEFFEAIDAAFQRENDENTKRVFSALREVARSLLTEKVLAASRAAAGSSQQHALELFFGHQQTWSDRLAALDAATTYADNLASHHDDASFWMSASEGSLDTIWGNDEDDVYAQLLQE
jgi:hypothetical protein